MITAYLKPTNFCNVDCAHCYLPATVRANKERMDWPMMRKTLGFLTEMKISGRHDNIHILWHGGEPLVLSPSWFEEAGAVLDEFFPFPQRIESMQTSLIPWRREFAKIAHDRWLGEVGTSMDFSSRLIKGSAEEYQKLWMSKVDMAREDNVLVIPGITPGKAECQDANFIYRWFLERNFWIWGIDRYSNISGELPNFPTNREHSFFLRTLFDLCMKDSAEKGRSPYIKAIVAGISGVLFGMPGDRWGSTCQSDFVVINPDGRLNNCPDKDSFESSYGSIQQGFGSFVSAPLRKKWIRLQTVGHRIDECATCENNTWCRSGCPITGNACTTSQGEVDECSGYKTFITHVRNFINASDENYALALAYYEKKMLPINLMEAEYEKIKSSPSLSLGVYN